MCAVSEPDLLETRHCRQTIWSIWCRALVIHSGAQGAIKESWLTGMRVAGGETINVQEEQYSNLAIEDIALTTSFHMNIVISGHRFIS